MANDVTPPKNNLPDHANRIQDLLGGMANIANSIEEAGGVASGLPFIGINNDGVWAYGQDRIEVEAGSLWAIDIRTWKHGYIAWPPNTAKERKPLGERMVPASAPLPDITTLPDVGQPYTLQFSFELLCTTLEDKGTVALFKNGSYGAKAAVKVLVEEVRKQARTNPDKLCPVVELQIRDYFHQEWKRTIYSPVLAIHSWIGFDEFDGAERVGGQPPLVEGAAEAPPAPEPEPEVVAAPPAAAATGRGRRPAPQPEPEVKAAATGRGRAAKASDAPVPAPAASRRRPGGRSQPNA